MFSTIHPTMKDQILIQLEDERSAAQRQLDSILAQIKQRKAHLEALPGAPQMPKSSTIRASAPRKGKRASPGTMKAAVLAALAEGDYLTNGGIRAKMKAAGYAFPLSTKSVSKMLQALGKKGDLEVKPDGVNTTYRLPSVSHAKAS